MPRGETLHSTVAFFLSHHATRLNLRNVTVQQQQEKQKETKKKMIYQHSSLQERNLLDVSDDWFFYDVRNWEASEPESRVILVQNVWQKRFNIFPFRK